MTRETILAAYRPLRASIQSVLKAAVQTCNNSDWRRAAKLLCFDLDEHDELLETGQHTEMLMDVALFEANQSGHRTYDRFLKGAAARKLSPEDQKVARDLQGAFFSIFRVDARHETAGLWLEDLLNGGPRIWIVDEGMEASASIDLCFGARLFNAGEYHAALGILLPLDDESVEDYTDLKKEEPKRSLAPVAYREAILANVLEILNSVMAEMDPADLDQLSDLMMELDVDLPTLPALPAPSTAPTARKRA